MKRILPVILLLCSCGASMAETNSLGFGRVSGVLTFYFNQYQGTKPDVGSKVFLVEEAAVTNMPSTPALVPGDLIPADCIVLAIEKRIQIIPPGAGRVYGSNSVAIPVLRTATADGSGRFTIDHVPVGKYIAICQSKNTNGKDIRDAAGKFDFTRVSVRPDEEADASLDFRETWLAY
jgi:hypothetical protein